MFGDEGQNLRQIELPDPKDGKCVLCGKQFSNMQNARRHVREMHGGEKRSFDCHLCGMVFTRQRNFKEHMTRFHPAPLSIPHWRGSTHLLSPNPRSNKTNKQTNNFPDGFADMINLFGISGGLDLDLTVDGAGVSRGIKCSHCGKIFATVGSSRRHYREVHAQSSKIECQYCGTTFGRKENLIRHISKFHVDK